MCSCVDGVEVNFPMLHVQHLEFCSGSFLTSKSLSATFGSAAEGEEVMSKVESEKHQQCKRVCSLTSVRTGDWWIVEAHLSPSLYYLTVCDTPLNSLSLIIISLEYRFNSLVQEGFKCPIIEMHSPSSFRNGLNGTHKPIMLYCKDPLYSPHNLLMLNGDINLESN